MLVKALEEICKLVLDATGEYLPEVTRRRILQVLLKLIGKDNGQENSSDDVI